MHYCIKMIAGVGLAYWKKDEHEYPVCCIVVINSITSEVGEKANSAGKIECSFVPGCFAFRELPLVLETVKNLKKKLGLYVLYGNDYLHPRHMKVAAHVYMYLNKLIIGLPKATIK